MVEKSISEQVLRNSFWNFLMRLFNKVGSLVFVVIIARFLLPESFGIYNLAISIALILLTFTDVGIKQALIRYLSDSIGKKKYKKAAAQYRYLIRLKLKLTVLFVFLLLVLSYPLSYFVFKKPLLFVPLLFSAIYLLVYSLESFYEAFFYAAKKIKFLTFKQSLWESIRIIGVLLVFLLVSSQYQVIGIIGVMIFSMFLILIILIYYIRKKVYPFIFEESSEKIDKKRMQNFILYLSLGTALMTIFGYVDTVMLGIFLPSQFVGYYSAAYAICAGFALLIANQNIILPFFTQLRKKRLERGLNKVLRYTSIISIPLIFGIFILGNYIIRTLFGYGYLPAVLPLYFLSFLIFEVPLTSHLRSLFISKEKPKYFVRILLFASILNVILNFLLITLMMDYSLTLAMTGAAIATVTSKLLYTFGMGFYVRKRLKIDTGILKNTVKPIIASLVMAIVLISINYFVLDMTAIIGILEVLIGAIVYFIVLWIIKGIRREDAILITKALRRA